MKKRGRDVHVSHPCLILPLRYCLPLHYCLPPAPPQWITDLVTEKQGTALQFLMEKTIDRSDVDRQQSRFRIPVDQVRNGILPALLPHELDAANLNVDLDLFTCTTKKKSKLPESTINDAGGSKKVRKKTAGRSHGGLQVRLYNRAKCWFDDVSLVRWDSNSSTVLKGRGWHPFSVLSDLKVDERVQVWGFRTGEQAKLCLVLAKIT